MAVAETHLRAFWENPIDNPPPGGESWGTLRARVHEGLSDLFDHSEGQSVLIVSHAGAIRAMLCETMGVSYEASWSFSLPLAVLLQLTIYLEDDGKVRAQLHALEGAP
jgi:broad specificity phosphatase PhoE